MQAQIIKLSKKETPKYETVSSAGLDLRLDLSRVLDFPVKVIGEGGFYKGKDADLIKLAPGSRALLPTGIKLQFVPNKVHENSDEFECLDDDEIYAGFLHARSGLAFKKGAALCNGVGVIDMDYTGEILVPIINLSNEDLWLEDNERICQLVVQKITQLNFTEVDSFKETERGEGGFGHTGTK